MPKIKYVGTSHFRTISKADFSALDIEHDAIALARHDLPAVQNTKKYDKEVEVSDAVAAWLKENEPKDWKVVAEKSEGEPDANANAGGATGKGQKPVSGNPPA